MKYLERIQEWIYKFIIIIFVVLVVSVITYKLFLLLGTRIGLYFISLIALIIMAIMCGVLLLSIRFLIGVFSRQGIYDKGGFLGRWYDNTLNKYGYNWVYGLGDVIMNNFSKEDLKIISPSANKGVYEKKLFWYLHKSGKRVDFIASDISTLEDAEKDERIDTSMYDYYSGKDAADIKDLVSESDPVDIIFDRKGALWYASSLKYLFTDKCYILLKNYYDVLSTGGMIIIDANRYSPLKHFAEITTYEDSTKRHLFKHCLYKKRTRVFISKNFSKHEVSIDNENKYLLLKKKESSENEYKENN